jgi:hypothetical protein
VSRASMAKIKSPNGIVESVYHSGRYAALVDSRLSTFRYYLSVPSSKVEESRNCLTLEGRTDVAHRNVGNRIPNNAA